MPSGKLSDNENKYDGVEELQSRMPISRACGSAIESDETVLKLPIKKAMYSRASCPANFTTGHQVSCVCSSLEIHEASLADLSTGDSRITHPTGPQR